MKVVMHTKLIIANFWLLPMEASTIAAWSTKSEQWKINNDKVLALVSRVVTYDVNYDVSTAYC